MTTQGKRIYPNEDGRLTFAEPGVYGKDKDGKWWAVLPIPVEQAINGLVIGNLSGHDVTEHEDGTITVSPSILVEHWAKTWHGYLERGVWREV